ncbi:hypothetical protein [Mycolicibacterium peregrinum]
MSDDVTQQDSEPEPEPAEDDEELGEKGKRALIAERKARREAERKV